MDHKRAQHALEFCDIQSHASEMLLSAQQLSRALASFNLVWSSQNGLFQMIKKFATMKLHVHESVSLVTVKKHYYAIKL